MKPITFLDEDGEDDAKHVCWEAMHSDSSFRYMHPHALFQGAGINQYTYALTTPVYLHCFEPSRHGS